MHRQNGFTIAEVLIALAIAVVVIGGAYAVYIMGLRTWQTGSAVAYLERSAYQIMDRICRGAVPSGRFGLREATPTTIQVTQVSTEIYSIQYKVDKMDPPTTWDRDDTTCRYYVNGTTLCHDPGDGSEVRVHKFGQVESLKFTIEPPQIVNVELTLADPGHHMQRRVSIRMNTEVFIRKSR